MSPPQKCEIKSGVIVPLTKSTVISMSLGLIVTVGTIVWLAASDRAKAWNDISRNREINDNQKEQLAGVHANLDKISQSMNENQRTLAVIQNAVFGIQDRLKQQNR